MWLFAVKVILSSPVLYEQKQRGQTHKSVWPLCQNQVQIKLHHLVRSFARDLIQRCAVQLTGAGRTAGMPEQPGAGRTAGIPEPLGAGH